jgi:competence protein ComEA
MKKILSALALLVLPIASAFAQVDVNKADQAALDTIRGLGPAKTKAILAERDKNGPFKDWADFESRVKGIGGKNAMKLSEAGLQVAGQARAGAPAPAKEEKK